MERKPASSRKLPRHSTVTINRKGLRVISEVKIKPNCSQIDLSSNRINNFEGLPQLENLTTLNLDNNPIRSFRGAIQLKNLKWISLKKTPISRNPYFKLMVIVAFGSQVNTINGTPVPLKIKEQAEKLGPSLRDYLTNGKVLANICPLRLIDNEIDDDEVDRTVDPGIELLKATQTIRYPSLTLKETIENSQIRAAPTKPSLAVVINEINATENLSELIQPSIISDALSRLNALREKFPPVDDFEYEEDIQQEEQVSVHSEAVIEIDGQELYNAERQNAEESKEGPEDNLENEEAKEVPQENKEEEEAKEIPQENKEEEEVKEVPQENKEEEEVKEVPQENKEEAKEVPQENKEEAKEVPQENKEEEEVKEAEEAVAVEEEANHGEGKSDSEDSAAEGETGIKPEDIEVVPDHKEEEEKADESKNDSEDEEEEEEEDKVEENKKADEMKAAETVKVEEKKDDTESDADLEEEDEEEEGEEEEVKEEAKPEAPPSPKPVEETKREEEDSGEEEEEEEEEDSDEDEED